MLNFPVGMPQSPMMWFNYEVNIPAFGGGVPLTKLRMMHIMINRSSDTLVTFGNGWSFHVPPITLISSSGWYKHV